MLYIVFWINLACVGSRECGGAVVISLSYLDRGLSVHSALIRGVV